MADESLSTGRFDSGQRLDHWKGFLARALPGISVAADRSINATWKSRDIRELRIVRICSQKALVQRWQTTAADPENRRTVAHIQSRGSCVSFDDDTATPIIAGDLHLARAVSPYSLNISERNVVILLDFPPELLSVEIPAGGRLQTRSAFVRALHDFALSVLDDEDNELHDEEDPEGCILGVFFTLLRKCIATDHPPEDDDLLQSRRVFEFIEGSIQDSSLRTNMIARHLSVSTRQIQRMFAELGMSPSQFILNRRVNSAAFLLRSSSFDGTMADLAMDVGFSDAAHFCRSFRRIFGITPTEYAKLQASRATRPARTLSCP